MMCPSELNLVTMFSTFSPGASLSSKKYASERRPPPPPPPPPPPHGLDCTLQRFTQMILPRRNFDKFSAPVWCRQVLPPPPFQTPRHGDSLSQSFFFPSCGPSLNRAVILQPPAKSFSRISFTPGLNFSSSCQCSPP